MNLLRDYEDFIDPGFKIEPGFVTDFASGDQAKFQQRYWELLLAHHFISMGYELTRKRAGPDFGFEMNGKQVWIEAVAPGRDKEKNIDRYYEEEARNGGGWFCAEVFHLRWTSAIAFKIHRYTDHVRRKLVSEDDIYIIAVNSALLGSLGMTGKSDYPTPVEVVFGVGAEYALVDVGSRNIIEQGYRREPMIMKPTTAGTSPVPKRFFLDQQSRGISAILTSSAKPEAQGWPPIMAVHNPYANNPLPLGEIGAKWEYYAENQGDHFLVKTAVG
jgi:hypothetical protein